MKKEDTYKNKDYRWIKRKSHLRTKPNSDELVHVNATKFFIRNKEKKIKFSDQLKKDINELLIPTKNELGYKNDAIFELPESEIIKITDEMIKKSKNPRKVFGLCQGLQNINKNNPNKNVIDTYKICTERVSEKFKGTGFLGRGKKKYLLESEIEYYFV
jgi:hypothetical protein